LSVLSDTPRELITVTGSVKPAEAEITDAHSHVWIAPVPGVSTGGPVLDDRSAIAAELVDYRQAGGGTVIDCQPGGCGRDGRVLSELARESQVYIVACTGFHLQKYYPPGHWLFQLSVDGGYALFLREITQGLEETLENEEPVHAGFIKVACEEEFGNSPMALIEAAAMASLQTGAAVGVHTEKGADAERIISLLMDFGLRADRVVLCHMDKRPDFGLHCTLAQEGVMLAYDTFYRPKYRPEENVWPLLTRMVGGGLDRQVSLATDIAEAKMWSRMGNGPGLPGFITQIIPRLEALGFEPDTIRRLVGENITCCLALPKDSVSRGA
jgi:predicted metal-dependent phosphotriesterase family hydrolase